MYNDVYYIYNTPFRMVNHVQPFLTVRIPVQLGGCPRSRFPPPWPSANTPLWHPGTLPKQGPQKHGKNLLDNIAHDKYIKINILSKYWNCVLHVFLRDKSVRPVMGLAPCHTEALQTRHLNGTPKAERCREPRFGSLFVFSVPRNDERKITQKIAQVIPNFMKVHQ